MAMHLTFWTTYNGRKPCQICHLQRTNLCAICIMCQLKLDVREQTKSTEAGLKQVSLACNCNWRRKLNKCASADVEAIWFRFSHEIARPYRFPVQKVAMQYCKCSTYLLCFHLFLPTAPFHSSVCMMRALSHDVRNPVCIFASISSRRHLVPSFPPSCPP